MECGNEKCDKWCNEYDNNCCEFPQDNLPQLCRFFLTTDQAPRAEVQCSELLSAIDHKIADVKNGDMLTARLLFTDPYKEEHHDRERALAMDDARNLLARALHTLQRCR
jgi:hypothetical protein